MMFQRPIKIHITQSIDPRPFAYPSAAPGRSPARPLRQRLQVCVAGTQRAGRSGRIADRVRADRRRLEGAVRADRTDSGRLSAVRAAAVRDAGAAGQRHGRALGHRADAGHDGIVAGGRAVCRHFGDRRGGKGVR